MPALLETRLLDDEHLRIIAVLRRLEGFTRRAVVPESKRPAMRSERDWSDVAVADYFRRCQWE